MNGGPDDQTPAAATEPTRGASPSAWGLREGASESPPAAPGRDGEDPRRTRRRTPDLGSVAVVAGLVGLLAGPFLIADPTARYVILIADVVALVLGGWSLWDGVRRSERLDMGITAVVAGAVSLYLFISYVSGPPPAPGGT